MKRALTAIMFLAAAGPAMAQSFQTALPVSPAERRAMESRLSTILELSKADQIASFTLPSGRKMTVRPYNLVRGNRQRPCRGYRIDLTGERGHTAVDGFRCKTGDGRAWVIVEPELVLAQEGGPLVLHPQSDPAVSARASNEPLYPADDIFAPEASLQDDGPPPVPRPSPREDGESESVALATPAAPDRFDPPRLSADANGTSDAAGSGSLRPFSDRVAAVLSAPAPETSIDPRPAADPDPVPAPAPAAAPESAPPPITRTEPARPAEPPAASAAPREVAAAPRPARNVTPGAETPTVEVAASQARNAAAPADEPASDTAPPNPTVVAALQDLDYLDAEASPSGEAVNEAIDAFAVDERFALPVSDDALMERLDAALERSTGLPPCGADADAQLCVISAAR